MKQLRKTMRVVMVSKALVVGAYQRKAEEIARLGVELVVLVPNSWKDRRGEQRAEKSHTVGYQLTPIPIRFNGHYHLHYYPTLKQEIGRLRPDILHMDEEPYNLATWQGLRIADKLGALPLFFTWQNLTRRYPPPFRWIEQINYRRAKLAVAGNQTASTVLRAKGFQKTIRVVPQFGVDPAIFTPGVANKNGTAESVGTLHIGYAGGLLPEKGVGDLIQSCAGLRTKWHLHIVGQGGEQARLLALAESLGVSASVDINPRIASDLMPAFYQNLDVLVLPSHTQSNWMEQFGRVLIEAMSCKVSVVGSSSGEIPNVIGDAGLVYPEGDVNALTEALQKLADNPTVRNRLASRGQERVLERYSMAYIATQTVDIYKEVIANGH